MTKQVRIENADMNTSVKVLVQTWDKGQDGQPDVLAHEQVLGHPTAMTNGNTYLTDTRYLIVKEIAGS